MKKEDVHPTKEGYCCACKYDIIGLERKLEFSHEGWIEEGRAQERLAIKKNIGFLRQWLNEKPTGLVTDEQIKKWLL